MATASVPPPISLGKVATQLSASTASSISANPREQLEFEARLNAWRDSYRYVLEADGLTAGGCDREFVYQQMVWQSLQIVRAQRRGIELIQAARERSVDLWRPDRVLKANELGATLARKPAIVVAKLQTFAEGAEWLIDRWEWLGINLNKTKTVTSEQYTKMYDLTGTPFDERKEYKETVSVDECLTTVHERIGSLRNTHVTLCRIDENERKRVLEGTSTLLSPEQRYNKRCEATALRLFNTFRKELLQPTMNTNETPNQDKLHHQAKPVTKAIPVPSIPSAPKGRVENKFDDDDDDLNLDDEFDLAMARAEFARHNDLLAAFNANRNQPSVKPQAPARNEPSMRVRKSSGPVQGAGRDDWPSCVAVGVGGSVLCQTPSWTARGLFSTRFFPGPATQGVVLVPFSTTRRANADVTVTLNHLYGIVRKLGRRQES